MRLLLIGHPVSQSLSPAIHAAALKELGLPHTYQALDTPPTNLGETVESSLKTPDFLGCNITHPHKLAIIPYLDALAPTAQEAGAVNTVERRGWELVGHNTDGVGALRALKRAGVEVDGARVAILGAGGAARAVSRALAPHVRHITILNRTPERAKQLARGLPCPATHRGLGEGDSIRRADLVVNATPVGMGALTGETPIKPSLLGRGQTFFDLIYNPPRTRLLAEAEKRGAKVVNGLWMLVYQAQESLRIWTGVEPDAEAMYAEALRALEVGGL